MDKNTIIGLLLIFGLFLGYSFYSSNKAKKAYEAQQEQAEKEAAAAAANKTDSTTVALADTTKPQPAPNLGPTVRTPEPHTTANSNGLFGYADTAKTGDFVVKTNKGEYHIARIGGYVNYVKFNDIYTYAPKGQKKPQLILFDQNTTSMSIDLTMNDTQCPRVQTKNCYFSSPKDTLIVKKDSATLALRMYPYHRADSAHSAYATLDSSAYIEFLYQFKANDFKFDYSVHFVNMGSYMASNKKDFTLNWEAQLRNVEKNYDYERDNTTLFFMDNLNEVDNLKERESDSKNFSTELKWVSFKQQFFTSTIIAKNAFRKGELKVNVPNGKNSKNSKIGDELKDFDAQLVMNVANTDDSRFDMSFYFGPNQYKQLKTYDLNLERQVPMGWGFFLLHWINRFIILPIFNWLEAYGISYGIIILILSVFIKIIILPVAYKTYMSSAKMRVLKPELEELNKKYPKQEDAMKKQQATMTLYKKAGVSPMSGCLPMLLQLPILYAMFRFFPASYELRQQPFLWADDLSTYDSILDLSFNIPFYGDHVSLFTLLMTVATIVYTWLNNRLMSVGNQDQMKMMKWMMYLMPILFLGMFNSFSAALTYYYLLINLITFLQMWIFRMAINEDKLRKQIAANMTKPVKKSRWQERMEAAMKEQQRLANQKK
ncbi:MAG: membrane protein insertase YidC [Bacteroidales bacterium]|nr:membrane protein insertase YidC [Bacteroidales bacterium]